MAQCHKGDLIEGVICVTRGGKPLWYNYGVRKRPHSNIRIRSPEMGEAKSEVG